MCKRAAPNGRIRNCRLTLRHWRAECLGGKIPKKREHFEYLRKTFFKEKCVLSMYGRKDKGSNKRKLWPSVIMVQKKWKKIWCSMSQEAHTTDYQINIIFI